MANLNSVDDRSEWIYIFAKSFQAMRLNELMDWIAEIITWSFGILTGLNNNFNWLIIVVMFIMAVIWIKKMADFNREARDNGTLK